MNILIITAGYLPVPNVMGGAVENILNNYLESNKHDKIVVYSIYDDKLNDYDYNKFGSNIEFRNIVQDLKGQVIRFQNAIFRRIFKNKLFTSFFDEKVLSDLSKRNEFDKYDLIILENNITIEKKLRNQTKTKIVLHLHNDYINKNIRNSNVIISNCDEVWTVSNFIENQVKSINKNVITRTLYNGVDFEKFIKTDGKIIEDYKRKYNIKNSDTVYVYVGRIFDGKGVKELINAFNIFSQNKNNVKLLIVGSPKSSKFKHKKYFEDCLQLANEKTFFVGQIPNNEISNIYKVSHVQLIPSMFEEAFGMILIEGIICGEAIIISNSGALPEITKGYAKVCDRNNIVNDLVDNMNYYYNNKKQINQDNKKLRNVIKNYTFSNYANNFNDLIHKIIEGGKNG